MLNFRQILLVGLGGMLGSIIRYLVSSLINAKKGVNLFPWATLFINISGSFIIGVVIGYSLKNEDFGKDWQLFLATGICGGFTTFSAFSNESYILLKQQNYSALFLYIGISIILSICATVAGYWVSRYIRT
jgi:fluoride exporter